MIKVNFLSIVVTGKESVIQSYMLDLAHWLVWIGVAAGLLFYVSILFKIKI